MKATIISPAMIGKVVTGKTLLDIKRALEGLLSVDGPRGLTAAVDTGATVHTELYHGHDYIRDRRGHIIYRSY